MRKALLTSVSTAAVLAAALLLAGCSGSGTKNLDDASSAAPSAGSTPSATPNAASADCQAPASGAVSDSVKVAGAVGSEPTVTIPSGLKADAIQRTVVSKGSGDEIKSGATVVVDFAFYDGTNGQKLDTEGYGAGSTAYSFSVGTGSAIPGLDSLVECANVGSRVVLAAPVADAFGSGVDSTQFGVAAGDSVVFVGDIKAVTPVLPGTAKADGTPQKPKAGFPTVTLANSGQPTLHFAAGWKPAKTTQIEVLKKGSGAKVGSGDVVSVQYQGTDFQTKKIFDQSWGRGVAAFATTGVVKGFGEALVGQTVGSQVLVTIAPADGYGNAQTLPTGIGKTDTLIFVIDILANTPVS